MHHDIEGNDTKLGFVIPFKIKLKCGIIQTKGDVDKFLSLKIEDAVYPVRLDL